MNSNRVVLFRVTAANVVILVNHGWRVVLLIIVIVVLLIIMSVLKLYCSRVQYIVIIFIVVTVILVIILVSITLSRVGLFHYNTRL